MADTANLTDAPQQRMRAAVHALQSVQEDPEAVRVRCLEWLAVPAGDEAALPPTARVIALWALGRAEYELGTLRESRRRLRQAADLARRLREPEMESSIRSSLSVTLLELGDTDGALQQLADALPATRPEARGRVLKQRAFVLYTLGRYAEALADFDAARPELERVGDRLGVARLLINRGICHLAMGSLDPAGADLRSCREIAVELDQRLIVAAADQNLGCVYARQHLLPESLAAFAHARASYVELGSPGRVMASLDADLAAALLAAGLNDEAVDAARRAVDQSAHHANRVQLAEAQLVLAHALAAAGHPAEAATHAATASRLFRRSQRFGAGTFAEYTALESRSMVGGRATQRTRIATQRRARELVDELDRFGWRLEAAHARTLAGSLAREAGDHDAARALLSPRAVRAGSVSHQVRGWHAVAQLRLSQGDVAGCRRALRNGLDAVAVQRALLGATELRVNSSAFAADLAATGLRVALAGGRIADVLEWSEHGRAATLRAGAARPPDDPELARLLGSLRQAHEQRLRDLTDAPEGADASAGRLLDLERAIIERTRQLPGSAEVDRRVPRLTQLNGVLQDRTLVSYFEHAGRLGAVTVHHGRAQLHELCPVEQLADESSYLDSAIRRSLIVSGSRRGAAIGWRQAAERLDALLLAPLLGHGRRRRDDSHLVVVPTGSLHSIPWGVLPSLRQRPFVIAPSASSWFHRGPHQPRAAVRHVGIAVGPDLPGAEREGALLSGLHGSVETLLGTAATVEATLALMQRSDLVHLAAHGRFRNDSPLFSAVQLSDGPMTVLDLDMLSSVASTIVLPVCNAAAAAVSAGDELIGPTAALLRLGVRTVVAPGRPIPDEASVDVMLRFHRLLVRGDSPATALATLRMADTDDDLTSLAACLLTCLGAD